MPAIILLRTSAPELSSTGRRLLQDELCNLFGVKEYPMMLFGHPKGFAATQAHSLHRLKQASTADAVVKEINARLGTCVSSRRHCAERARTSASVASSALGGVTAAQPIFAPNPAGRRG